MKLKSSEEIEILREGGKRHREILNKLAGMVSPGIPVIELENEARRLIEANGDTPAHLHYTPLGARRPFPAVLCVSINDEIVHGIPNEGSKVMKEGDLVSIDVSIWHEGLVTDAALTVACGQIRPEEERLLEVTKQALIAGIREAKPGNCVGDIGFAISKIVRESKFSLAEDLAGHGVGYSVHEDPFVPNVGSPGDGEELLPGMVLAIEPMVNMGKSGIKLMSDGYTIKTRDGSKSAHFEHSVAITEKGNIVLTQ